MHDAAFLAVLIKLRERYHELIAETKFFVQNIAACLDGKEGSALDIARGRPGLESIEFKLNGTEFVTGQEGLLAVLELRLAEFLDHSLGEHGTEKEPNDQGTRDGQAKHVKGSVGGTSLHFILYSWNNAPKVEATKEIAQVLEAG